MPGSSRDRRDGYRIFYRLADQKDSAKRRLYRFLREVCTSDKAFENDNRQLRSVIRAGACTLSEWKPYWVMVAAKGKHGSSFWRDATCVIWAWGLYGKLPVLAARRTREIGGELPEATGASREADSRGCTGEAAFGIVFNSGKLVEAAVRNCCRCFLKSAYQCEF